jgi:hypothetical protein
MIWRKRPSPPAPGGKPATGPSEETRRARAAAREAAIQLDQVRAQRDVVNQTSQELADLNEHNGFYTLVRQALGA